MTRQVIALLGDADPYAAQGALLGPDTIVLRFDSTNRGRLHEDMLWRALEQNELVPPQIAIDFYRVAAAVFSADLRISREEGFDRWQRDFCIHIAVDDPELWDAVQPQLQKTLGFLSGDRWAFKFRKGASTRAAHKPRTIRSHRTVSKVCLLSGGLDSFIGAADEVADGHDLICVSHNAAGSGTFSSPAQDRALSHLQSIRGVGAVSHVKASVSPPTSVSGSSEPTQRSRSIMFLGIGVLVATAAARREERQMPLVIPENGFISLNVPLTSSRLGSLSTRTTHPYFIACLEELFLALGIDVPLQTPYRYTTKGQMLVQARNQAVVAAGARDTVSCAHPSVKRFNESKKNHCGYCVPCIIRRAAMLAAGLDRASDYTFDVTATPSALTPGQARDLKAFQMALSRRSPKRSRVDVIAVAPLPGGADALRRSLQTYEAGLDEVDALI